MATRKVTNDDSQSDCEYDSETKQSHHDPELSGIETFHEFNDGHTFRNIIDFLKQNFSTATLRIYPKMITIQESDPNGSFIVDIVIRSWCLPRYYYNSKQPFVPFSFSLNDFHSLTRSIGTKTGFMIYKHDEKQDPNGNLYFQILGATDDVDFIAPKLVTLEKIEIPTYNIPEDEPSVVIPISDFCSLCKTLCHIKCGYVYIYGYYRGLKFEGCKTGNIRGKVKTFGSEDPPPSEIIHEDDTIQTNLVEDNKDDLVIDLTDDNEDDDCTKVVDNRSIISTSIGIDRIKSYTKYINISGQRNVLLVYIEKDKSLKLVADIGGYGEMRVYIK